MEKDNSATQQTHATDLQERLFFGVVLASESELCGRSWLVYALQAAYAPVVPRT